MSSKGTRVVPLRLGGTTFFRIDRLTREQLVFPWHRFQHPADRAPSLPAAACCSSSGESAAASRPRRSSRDRRCRSSPPMAPPVVPDPPTLQTRQFDFRVGDFWHEELIAGHSLPSICKAISPSCRHDAGAANLLITTYRRLELAG